jgi:aspartyl/asparaginyl beta-hydroxylase (cupin superfamily)
LQVASNPHLWGQERIGKLWKETYPGLEIEEIMARYTRSLSRDELQCFWEAPANVITEAKVLAVSLCAAYKADQIGRVMFTRLPPGQSIPRHSDTTGDYCKYYTRFHVPIISDPGVRFLCGDESAEMVPGEVWWTNISLPHSVVNDSPSHRVQLLVDLHIA